MKKGKCEKFMNRFKLAKLVLFLSAAAFAKPVEMIPKHLSCGIYRATGKLKRNTSGGFILSLNGNSFSPFALLLLGGGVAEKEKHLDTQVKVEFYYPRENKGGEPSPVFLQKFLPTPKRTPLDGVELLHEEKCFNASRYVGHS
jgi:hypothetical protein